MEDGSAEEREWSRISNRRWQGSRGHNEDKFHVVHQRRACGVERVESGRQKRVSRQFSRIYAFPTQFRWGYEDLLPYFMKSEKAAETLTGKHHGRQGKQCHNSSAMANNPPGEWCVRSLKGWSFSFWSRCVSTTVMRSNPLSDYILASSRLPLRLVSHSLKM